MKRSISVAIIESVADATGIDPIDLNPPLSKVVDPDALDTIFRADTGELSFTYHDHRVTVTHTGTVNVTPIDRIEMR